MTKPERDLAPLQAALAADLDAAFPDLVRALGDDVFSGAFRLTGDRQAAEDIAQETFLRAYRALDGYDADRIASLQVRGWIWTIAANLCRNRARSRRRHPETGLDGAPPPIDPRPGPEHEAIRRMEADDLEGMITALPWHIGVAVVLRHVVGLGVGEIAAALHRPVGTVKSDIHRGLTRLRNAMEGGS